MTPEQIEIEMRKFDERIGETERALELLYEQKREFINRHNLNKPCDHSFVWFTQKDRSSKWACSKCGEDKPHKAL